MPVDKSASSKEFTEAMEWGQTQSLVSTYASSTEWTNFTPLPISEQQSEAEAATDEPSVASTEAPHYYAWELLPPPPPSSSLEPKEKKRRSKITKLATKVRLGGGGWTTRRMHTINPSSNAFSFSHLSPTQRKSVTIQVK